MGIYSDVQANTTSFDNALPRDGVSRVINREIQAMVEAVDLARASTYDAANAVHTINADTAAILSCICMSTSTVQYTIFLRRHWPSTWMQPRWKLLLTPLPMV